MTYNEILFRIYCLLSYTAQPDGDEDAHRRKSRYREGLMNMADLMTDVDLTEDVLSALKRRFDLDS